MEETQRAVQDILASYLGELLVKAYKHKSIQASKETHDQAKTVIEVIKRLCEGGAL